MTALCMPLKKGDRIANKLLQYGADAFLVNTDNTAQHQQLTLGSWKDSIIIYRLMILTTVFHTNHNSSLSKCY